VVRQQRWGKIINFFGGRLYLAGVFWAAVFVTSAGSGRLILLPMCVTLIRILTYPKPDKDSPMYGAVFDFPVPEKRTT
jgi:hypothetical protein